MIPHRAPGFPLAGAAALVVVALALAAQVWLLAAPHPVAPGYDLTDPSARDRRALDANRARRARLEVGIAVQCVGAAAGGWAALVASRRGSADRFLAGSAGVCCAAGMVTWLALLASCLTGEPDTGPRRPELTITYD